MVAGMPKSLENAANIYAAQTGYPTVQAILNRTGAARPERGKVIPFRSAEPNRWWVGRD